jgi:hypothetical protein
MAGATVILNLPVSVRLVDHYELNSGSSKMYCTALRLKVAWLRFFMRKLRVPVIIWTCGCMPVKDLVGLQRAEVNRLYG